jgi:hypothetical protein
MHSRLSRNVREVRRRIARSTAHLRFRDVVLRIGRNNSFVAREDLARRSLVGDGIEIGAGTLARSSSSLKLSRWAASFCTRN